MGSEPLKLQVGDWTLEVSVKDHWVQVAIVTDGPTHYVRLPYDQAYELRDYLQHNMPYRAGDPL